jgi:hypothetical protein
MCSDATGTRFEKVVCTEFAVLPGRTLEVNFIKKHTHLLVQQENQKIIIIVIIKIQNLFLSLWLLDNIMARMQCSYNGLYNNNYNS